MPLPQVLSPKSTLLYRTHVHIYSLTNAPSNTPAPATARGTLQCPASPDTERSKGLPLPIFVSLAVGDGDSEPCVREGAAAVGSAAGWASDVAVCVDAHVLSSVDVMISPVVMVLGPIAIGINTCTVFPSELVVVSVTVLVTVLCSPLLASSVVLRALVACSTLPVGDKATGVDLVPVLAHA